MKNKKIVIIFSTLLIIILIGGFFVIKFVKEKQKNKIEEYTPQEEITEEQFRQTIVSLYFKNKENDKIEPEARLVDIREIINNPYERLINLLIEGPKNDKNERLIPENTKLLKSYIEKDCVTLDFSKEFLDYKKENEDYLIESIVKTLTELSEVNKIKILIEGTENDNFKQIYERK